MGSPYKLLIFAKRRPGMSPEAFRAHYETTHAPLCLRYMAGVDRYVRRYLEPAAGMPEMEADVVTEVWMTSRAALDLVLANAAQGRLPEDVLAVEHRLFDRSRTRFCAVTECETDLSPGAA